MVMPAKLEQAIPQPMPQNAFNQSAITPAQQAKKEREAFMAEICYMNAMGTSDARAMRRRPALVKG